MQYHSEMEFKKPKKLVEGDTVAVVSPSWGGPSLFPEIFDRGIRELKDLGLKVKEYPTASMSVRELRENPMLRAEDICMAFSDSEVRAIVASIGGDDSVRILDHLDWDEIRDSPKIILGYSDTTTLLTTLNLNGLVTFHGPCVMAGFAQIKAFGMWREHIREILFTNWDQYRYASFETYAEGYPDWSDLSRLGQVLPKRPSTGWNWIQGDRTSKGELFGGCIEVLEVLKGTKYWPEIEFWNGKILFLETSEEKPSITQIRWILRNYGVQGVFERVSALLFGRARDYTEIEKQDLDNAIIDIVAGEFGIIDLPIVTNMDFGHTDPQFILPLGVRAQVDCTEQTFCLVEAALSD